MTEQTDKGLVHTIDDEPDRRPQRVDRFGCPLPIILPFVAVGARGELVCSRLKRAR